MSQSCVCAAGGAGDPGAEVDRSTSEREEEEADEEEGPLPLNHRSNRYKC